jgi:hypothetical protein
MTHLTNHILGLQEFIGNTQIVYSRLAKVLKTMIVVTNIRKIAFVSRLP